MILSGLSIVYLLGFTIINRLSKELQLAEKIGLSFLIGIGLETVFMFFLDIIHIHINALSLMILSFILFMCFHLKNFSRAKNISVIFKQIPAIKIRKISIFRINFVWIAFILLICFLLVTSALKSFYWPTTSYDSVAGYDLMGKTIAHEGKINVSLFQFGTQGPRAIYPPLVEGSFAFAYIFKCASSKIMTTLFYFSLIFVFYSLLRRYVNSINASFFTFLLIITPEMYAHSSLSLTNVPGAAYAGLAIIYLFIWLNKHEKHDLYLSSILMGFNVWTRNDGVAFCIAGFVLLFIDTVRNKTWKELALYTGVAFLPLLSWTLYLKFVLGLVQDRFVTHFFWDARRFIEVLMWAKLFLTHVSFYGLTFYIFMATLLLNIKNIFKDKFSLIALIFVSFIVYLSIYYQLDYSKQDSLATMMKASFKRALFYFVPMVLFYASTNKVVNRLFQYIERFRVGNTALTP